MWPWEHVVVGYLAYSLFSRIVFRESPGGPAALAVVVGSLLPDLVDKPLAWQFGVFETSYALGHSVFFAVPIAVVAAVMARYLARTRTGLGFSMAYMIHLPSDLVPWYVQHGTVPFDRLLWPIRTTRSEPHVDLADGFFHFFLPYVDRLFAGDPYLLGQVGLVVATVVLWLVDGAPGPGAIVRGIGRTYDSMRAGLTER